MILKKSLITLHTIVCGKYNLSFQTIGGGIYLIKPIMPDNRFQRNQSYHPWKSVKRCPIKHVMTLVCVVLIQAVDRIFREVSPLDGLPMRSSVLSRSSMLRIIGEEVFTPKHVNSLNVLHTGSTSEKSAMQSTTHEPGRHSMLSAVNLSSLTHPSWTTNVARPWNTPPGTAWYGTVNSCIPSTSIGGRGSRLRIRAPPSRSSEVRSCLLGGWLVKLP